MEILKLFSSLFPVFKKHAAEINIPSYHRIISPIIIVGNVFSIFPIFGTCFVSYERLKFILFNPIALYSLIIQFLLVTELVLLVLMVSKHGFTLFFAGEIYFSVF